MKANEELFNAYVSEEFRKSAGETKQDIEAKINNYIGEFRRHLDTLVKDVEKTDYAAQFQQETDLVIKQAQAAAKQVENIAEIIAELEKKAPALTEQVNKLKLANSHLKTELDGINDKASAFGTNVGKYVASGVKQVITGGLPIF
jgi:DNA repair exonuclease SbcCD ATPase subunit